MKSPTIAEQLRSAKPGDVVIVYSKPSEPDLRQIVIDVLRQQEELKKKLHGLLERLRTNNMVGV